MKSSSSVNRSLLLSCLLALCLFTAIFTLTSCRKDGGNEDPTATGEISAESLTDVLTEPATEPSTTPATEQVTEAKTEPPVTEVVTRADDVIMRTDALEITYTEAQYDEIKSKVGLLLDYIAKNDPSLTEEFLAVYKIVEDVDYAELEDQYLVAEVMSMVLTNDEKTASDFSTLSEYYHEMLKELIMMYDDIYESVYAEEFFKEWTEEEIAVAVEMAKSYSDELSQLKTEYDALKTEFYALTDAGFKNKSAELYMRAIELNKRMAAAAGYDNYMDYAYKTIYDREYTPADVQKMTEYVKTYVVPQIQTLIGRVQVLLGNISAADNNTYNVFMNSELRSLGAISGYGTPNPTLVRVIDEYYTAMGGDMLNAYHDMWDNNYFVVTNNGALSRSGAFSVYFNLKKHPLFYFGPGYQNIFTVIHEAGHCYAMKTSESGNMPIDLAEVHSQGSEWMFTSFIRKEMSKSAYQIIAYYKLFSDFASIANCVSVDAFEQYVYTHDDYTAADLDGIMTNIMKELGIYDIFSQVYADPVGYWHYVTTDNPGYYISYAMSLVPSLSLYAMSLDDFDTAAAAYQSISKVGEYDTFTGALASASISSPFEESTYVKLAALPNVIRDLT